MSTADVNDRISTAMLEAIVGGEMRVHRYLTVRQDRAVWLIIIAIAVVILMGLMAAWFAWRYRRAPTTGERWRLLGVYGGGLALLYIGLLTMMALQDNPSPMGLVIFALHYFSYPFFAWLFFSRHFHKGPR